MFDIKKPNVKMAQKAAQYLRIIGQLFNEASRDDINLRDLSIVNVEFSQDRGVCHVLFYCTGGLDAFNEKFQHLKMYKPSMRAALAKNIPGRYTPDLMFRYDDSVAKAEKMHWIMEKLKDEGKM